MMNVFSPPLKTRYRLSRGAEDYGRCQELLRILRLDDTLQLAAPVVCAWRDDTLIGFISTKDEPFVHVSMLAVDHGVGVQRSFVTLRLLEKYEQTLKQIGLSHYYFHVAADGSHWAHRMAREAEDGGLGVREYQRVLSGTWYIRSLEKKGDSHGPTER